PVYHRRIRESGHRFNRSPGPKWNVDHCNQQEQKFPHSHHKKTRFTHHSSSLTESIFLPKVGKLQARCDREMAGAAWISEAPGYSHSQLAVFRLGSTLPKKTSDTAHLPQSFFGRFRFQAQSKATKEPAATVARGQQNCCPQRFGIGQTEKTVSFL